MSTMKQSAASLTEENAELRAQLQRLLDAHSEPMTAEEIAQAEERAPVREPEEYASVTVSIDHLVTRAAENGHTVVKNIWSTESALESVLAQINYFSQGDLLTPEMVGKLAETNHKAGIFVYTVNEELTNIIVDAALWSEMMNTTPLTEGTVLSAHAALITLATDMKASARKDGRSDRLLVFISH